MYLVSSMYTIILLDIYLIMTKLFKSNRLCTFFFLGVSLYYTQCIIL